MPSLTNFTDFINFTAAFCMHIFLISVECTCTHGRMYSCALCTGGSTVLAAIMIFPSQFIPLVEGFLVAEEPSHVIKRRIM